MASCSGLICYSALQAFTILELFPRIVKECEEARVREETPQRVCVCGGGDMAANTEGRQGKVGVASVACGHAGAKEEEEEEEEEEEDDLYDSLDDQV